MTNPQSVIGIFLSFCSSFFMQIFPLSPNSIVNSVSDSIGWAVCVWGSHSALALSTVSQSTTGDSFSVNSDVICVHMTSSLCELFVGLMRWGDWVFVGLSCSVFFLFVQSGLIYSEQEWGQEWDNLLKLASPQPRKNGLNRWVGEDKRGQWRQCLLFSAIIFSFLGGVTCHHCLLLN